MNGEKCSLQKEERKMICPKCGNKVKEGDVFCTNCGAKIEKGQGKSQTTKK